MAEKRTKKAIDEAKEAKANEQLRRKSGKVPGSFALRGVDADFRVSFEDIGQLRDDIKAKESLKEMEKRKQGESWRMPHMNLVWLTQLGCREAR